MLGLGLHPEIHLLPTAAKRQDKQSPVGRTSDILVPLVFDEGREGGVAGDGDEVCFGLGAGGGAWAPAEVDEVVFGAAVEVEVAWCGDRGDFAAGFGAAAGFEGDEGRGGHV